MQQYDKAAPDYVRQRRRAFKDLVQRYLNTRPSERSIGAFIDEEGCRHVQFGLGGTSFILTIGKNHDLQGEVLRRSKSAIIDGLQKKEEDRDAHQKHLLKDIPRITTKSSLISLWLDDEAIIKNVLDQIIDQGSDQGLIRIILDRPERSGDVLTTAYILQIIHLSGERRHQQYSDKIKTHIERLERELHDSDIDLIKKLYLSTTICMYSFEENISYHRKLLKKLYESETDWFRALSDQSPFIETWYGDEGQGKAEQRYVKIPTGYIILSSIYIAFGNENDYFKFPAVKKIFKELKMPLDVQIKNDRSKSAVYYVFFVFVSLFPSTYINVKKSGFIRRYLHIITYMIANRTKIGLAVVFLTVLSGSAALYYSILIANDVISGQGFDKLPDWLRAAGMTLSGVLGSMRTSKR